VHRHIFLLPVWLVASFYWTSIDDITRHVTLRHRHRSSMCLSRLPLFQ